MAQLTFTNPLHSTLGHFVRELNDTLRRSGVEAEERVVSAVEGLNGPAGKLRMLGRAVSNINAVRSTATHGNLQIWPSLGLAEMPLWRSGNGPGHYVILHDPIPLRRQAGFDALSRFIAARVKGAALPTIVVHSRDAAAEAKRLLPHFTIVELMHPVLSAKPVARGLSEKRRVVVAGQYKPERDLGLLRALGPMLKRSGIDAHIYGRGWPDDIDGWEVDSRFVSEIELDAILRDASAMLLPYRNYFQSGIAVRALELGTLTVSPRNSFAEDLSGVDSGLLFDSLDPELVLSAIEAAVDDSADAVAAFEAYKARADASWSRAPWVD
jgi:glycosyltransferase involved in cell wall biosynthesis